MKKSLIIVFISLLAFSYSHAQTGELSLNLGGGYATKHKNALFGLNIDYNIADHFQLSLSHWMNPSIETKEEFTNKIEKYGMYATNLDARFFVLHMRDWATGPSLGGQFLIYDDKNIGKKENLFGFNLGWHIRANITDNLRVTGGWKWTSLTKNEPSYHLFYLGVGWAFELF